MNWTEECGGGGGSFAGVVVSSASATVWQSPNASKRRVIVSGIFKSVFLGVALNGACSIFHFSDAVCVRVGI